MTLDILLSKSSQEFANVATWTFIAYTATQVRAYRHRVRTVVDSSLVRPLTLPPGCSYNWGGGERQVAAGTDSLHVVNDLWISLFSFSLQLN